MKSTSIALAFFLFTLASLLLVFVCSGMILRHPPAIFNYEQIDAARNYQRYCLAMNGRVSVTDYPAIGTVAIHCSKKID